MEIVILPNYVRDAINKKLDTAIAECPGAEADRELFFSKMLAYFYEHNELPEFRLVKKGKGGKHDPF